jgi:hypothetical protein
MKKMALCGDLLGSCPPTYVEYAYGRRTSHLIHI